MGTEGLWEKPLRCHPESLHFAQDKLREGSNHLEESREMEILCFAQHGISGCSPLAIGFFNGPTVSYLATYMHLFPSCTWERHCA